MLASYDPNMGILLGLRCRHFWECALLLGTVFFGVLPPSGPMPALGQTSLSASSHAGDSDRLPISTSSPEAAKLFEEGLRFLYDAHYEQALAEFRKATKKDPKFAQAWARIMWTSPDPVEARQAAEAAQQTSQHVTPGEKLLMKWWISTYKGNLVDAIAAMNDLLAMYSRDAQLNLEAGVWLSYQGEHEAAAKFLTRALEVDPKFAVALNINGYNLAAMHRYAEAIPYMKRYAEEEPNDHNPRDSLAEILQEGGRLEESLAEYREALKLDPKFYFSQWGLGGAHALLGQQDRAREEYAKALPMMAYAPKNRLKCQILSAITYAREGNVKQARVQLAVVLKEATKLQLNDYQSLIHQDLALLEESPAAAFRHLDQAEAVLQMAGAMSEGEGIQKRSASDPNKDSAGVRIYFGVHRDRGCT